jgi:hypothetical protein
LRKNIGYTEGEMQMMRDAILDMDGEEDGVL